MRNLLFLLLSVVALASARMTLNYSTDRIESGMAFELRLDVPIRELAESRDVPNFTPQNGFVYRGMDSTDTRVEDFFGRGYALST